MKNIALLTFMLLGIICYGQSNTDNRSESSSFLAIENQDGIQVIYTMPESANGRYFLLEIKNLSSTERTVAYKVMDANKQAVASLSTPVTIRPGDVFSANDLTLAVYVSDQAKLSEYVTELSIK